MKGVVGMRRALIAVAVWLLVLVGAAPAFAGSPWWHMSSLSRPSYIQPGKATDEVQEIRVVGEEGLYFIASSKLSFDFMPEGQVLLPAEATPGEVQSELESVYGEGNVQVG